jgi:acetyl esterase/lipase
VRLPPAPAIAYGDHPTQVGNLYLPPGDGPFPLVVLIHGGFWRAGWDRTTLTPLARDLATRGFAAWNVEYRTVGAGGGWPGTFDDVAAGIDRLADLDVDTESVVAIGHSAGGHLAVWAAGRAERAVRLTGVVAQAGVLALARAQRDGVGGGTAERLVGGTPDEVPDRYRTADPIAAVPLDAPVLCVHARADDEVPYAQSEGYVAAATQSGGVAALRETAGDHYTLIDPATDDWRLVVDALPALMAGRLPA